MEREADYLLHLLGAHLREETPTIRNNIDWSHMIQLALNHGVSDLLGYMVISHPICADQNLKKTFRMSCMNTMAVFGRRAVLAGIFSDMLAEHGIDHILMKGYILRQFYPIPELRTFTDIDIVIRPEDRARVHQLMLEQGFLVKTDWEPTFGYYHRDEYYELHTDLIEDNTLSQADYRSYFRQMWQHVQAVSPHRYEFTPEFHFLYLLTHIAKHIHGSGAGLRMYLDIAVFIKHYGNSIDWDFIVAELKHLKLYAFARVIWTAVQEWFGIPSPVSFRPVSESVMDEFTAFTLEGGVFGHHNREDALASLKHTDQEEAGSRMKFLLRRLFPAAKTIETRYTYLQKYPWLLPAAWIHRLVITRNAWKTHAHEARTIFSADTDEVRRLQRIIKNIGL